MSFEHLNSKQIRRVQKAIWKENEKFSEKFVELPISDTQSQGSRGAKRIKVFRNNKFLAQIFQESDSLRLSVNRTSIDNKGRWQDGITWDELNFVKNNVGFADFDALEVYPAQKDLVNVANIRHLWIVTEGKLPFVWRNEDE
jgi:hypothetical protein